jgi:hypothetical protein
MHLGPIAGLHVSMAAPPALGGLFVPCSRVPAYKSTDTFSRQWLNKKCRSIYIVSGLINIHCVVCVGSVRRGMRSVDIADVSLFA